VLFNSCATRGENGMWLAGGLLHDQPGDLGWDKEGGQAARVAGLAADEKGRKSRPFGVRSGCAGLF